MHVGLTHVGGCNFWFSGTPTETASYISLGQALGDDVALPSTITINLFDSDGQLFLFATFQSHAASGKTTPIENGCYAPAFPAICLERHLNQIRLNLAYHPYSETAPVNQPAISGIPLLAQGALHNNYARLDLMRTSGYRTLPPRPVPELQPFGVARMAVLSPTEFVWQMNDEPSFSARQYPLSISPDWAYFGAYSSRWLLTQTANGGIFGGFRITFDRVVGALDSQREGASWHYPATWDFGDGRLECTPSGCDLFLSFSIGGPEFLLARFPRGGLGLNGVYTETTPGVWKRILVRDED